MLKIKNYTNISISVFFMLFFFLGLAIGGFHLPPYDIIHDIYLEIFPKKISNNQIIEIDIKELDLKEFYTINNESDLIHKRSSMINYIWKQDELPFEKIPSIVEKNVLDERFNDMENLERIERLISVMDYGVDSKIYLFHAKNSNNELVIYHQGHLGSFELGKKTIQYFLNNNYSVMAFSMPLKGDNEKPMVKIPKLGNLKLDSHNDFIFIQSDNFSPLKFFLNPITESLNYVQEEYGFKSVKMIGISGGGWTTILYSAVDPRISQSYPVAAGTPLVLRFMNEKDLGDYEQNLPDFYKDFNYIDLYMMGSNGEGRNQIQFFNGNDPCCFSGNILETALREIELEIKEKNIGKFKIFIDKENDEHSISDLSLKVILNDFDT